jgi:hypothetical protein
MALTDTAIRTLKPGAKDYKAVDEKGLYLLVTPTGGRLWQLEYRSAGGVERKLSLGSYPDISLMDARDLRDDARKLLASGIDPAEKKRRDAAQSGIDDLALGSAFVWESQIQTKELTRPAPTSRWPLVRA